MVFPRIDEGDPGRVGRLALRGMGELFVTVGLVVLLFVAYEVYVTDLISAGGQEDANVALDELWSAEGGTVPPAGERRRSRVDLVPGEAFANMHVPVFRAGRSSCPGRVKWSILCPTSPARSRPSAWRS